MKQHISIIFGLAIACATAASGHAEEVVIGAALPLTGNVATCQTYDEGRDPVDDAPPQWMMGKAGRAWHRRTQVRRIVPLLFSKQIQKPGSESSFMICRARRFHGQPILKSTP